MRAKEPLYRKVNTRTHRVHHGNGGEYRWSRNTKREDRTNRGSMHDGHRHGLDYTPLFKFLLAHVGDDWAAVHSEAVARLDRAEPIFWMVARSEADRNRYIRVGECSYYSGLYVDDENRLARVDPDLRVEDMEPSCACCTHTLNGSPFTSVFKPFV
ncbi:hypothetical protein EN829_020265 [Mesorhizobium sp. M00.F.Ca.ET.186.01.1.1]|nr:hypothetical protein EN848_29090 [bacterium M00.F.Ca.ET.205.01.1.1]TGU50364.1 hypothetical protein EN795_22310 [bacterium M00.F.Ca.ET.152.01.1.1]TGV33840.1 hypothetical protein EN829_020265 [Mesorhizobium sp. M00.F.Ca.ET.186.01.1.1]TGZ40728.1 hypothetical protein EN805_21705 [bacterium M00.F.Ca.ET.162.01.1.1]